MTVSARDQGLSDMDELCVQTIRFLSMDGVQKAKSGHPGMPMGMAAAAYTLWMRHLRFNPQDPRWLNRDRFILSAGHGSMLLYSLLHLAGYDLSLEGAEEFPAVGLQDTRPPNMVKRRASRSPLVRWARAWPTPSVWRSRRNTWLRGTTSPAIRSSTTRCTSSQATAVCRRASRRASSLAGHLGLDNLIVIYDDNHHHRR